MRRAVILGLHRLRKDFPFAILAARPARAAPEKTRTDPGAGARCLSPGISLDAYTGRAGREVRRNERAGPGSQQARSAGCRPHSLVSIDGQGGIRPSPGIGKANPDLRKERGCRRTGLPTVSFAGPGRFDWRARTRVSNEDQRAFALG